MLWKKFQQSGSLPMKQVEHDATGRFEHDGWTGVVFVLEGLQ